MVVTFYREAMLARTVRSCLVQRGIDPSAVEIVVVDNSPDATARGVAETLRDEAARVGVPLRFVHEPRPGVSHPRNAGVKAAAAELVAFEVSDSTERLVHHPAMDMPEAQLLGFRIGGLTLHAWDLARASGGDEALDSELVEAVWAQLSPMAPFIAETGVFGVGPSGEVGEGAPLQVRLLDLSGRRP